MALTSRIAHSHGGSLAFTFPFGNPQLAFAQNPCTSKHYNKQNQILILLDF